MYQALGAKVPVFGHLPLILGPDKQRLSKRHGATSVGAYRDEGILPEALVNFLALLGWTPPGQKEIVPIDAMIRDFDLSAVSKSNAVFDLDKLAWMNSEYVRSLPADRLVPMVREELAAAGLTGSAESDAYATDAANSQSTSAASPMFGTEESFRQTVLLLQSRARTVKDFAGSFRAFFSDDFPYDPDAVKKFWKDAALASVLDILADRLSLIESFDLAGTESALRAFADERAVKAGLLINATRVALTGQGVAPSLFDVMVMLGRDRVVARMRRAAEYLQTAPGSPAESASQN